MNLIQLIRDFRKWREEKYKEKYDKVIIDIVYTALVNVENCGERTVSNAEFVKIMLRYGIEHRNEILKKVKI